MLSLQEFENLEKGLYFKNTNIIGKGWGGSVYHINKKFVVKKFSSRFNLSLFSDPYQNEINTTITLSSFSISPKVIYHSKKNDKNRYFVMEKMDYTLDFMIKNKIFLNFHLEKLEKLLDRLNKTRYRHFDFHYENIMWSEKQEDFRIIDWETYYLTRKPNKNRQSPDFLDRIKKKLSN